MTVGHLVVLAALSVGLIAYGRRSLDRFWSIGGFVILTTLSAVAIRDGVDSHLLRGPNDALVLAAESIFAIFFLAEGLGLPRAVATRVGLGLHSRELEFDWHLARDRSRFFDRVKQEFSTGAPPDRAPRDARARLARIQDLRAPDPDWAALRDELLTLDERYLDLWGFLDQPEHLGDLPDAYVRANERWAGLRARSYADAAAMARTPLSRWLQQNRWPIAFGAGAVLEGLGILQVAGGRPLSMDHLLFWPGVICLGFGLLGLVSIWGPLGRRLFR